ncbi:MAG: LacI family DNA-binding transcriptional regulator [Verrucomicrobiales bacterium]
MPTPPKKKSTSSRSRRASKARATQADIAKALGITQASVSLVLSSKGKTNRVSKEVRKQVMQMAKKLSYRPHPGAQLMKGGDTGVVGVLVRNITDHFNAAHAEALESEISARGHTSFIGHTHESLDRIENYLDEFAFRGVRSLLCLEPLVFDTPKLLSRILEEFTNVVFFTDHRDPALCIVDVGRHEATRLAVRHLAAAGRQRIALATWPPKGGHLRSIEPRRRGYAEEIEAQGLDYDESLIFKWTGKSVFGPPSEAVIDRLIADVIVGKKADAVIVHDDYWAMRLFRQAAKNGITVPDDLAVVGMGNEPVGELTYPAITTVDLRHASAAAPMVAMLERQQNDEEIPEADRLHVVEPSLIARESA